MTQLYDPTTAIPGDEEVDDIDHIEALEEVHARPESD